MALEGLASHVTVEAVNGLLLARAPEILDAGDDAHTALFEAAVRGATSEVVPLVGTDPGEGPRRDLAVRCIAYGVAAEIESSLFPEQQAPGDSGRARYLIGRYNELRKQLIEMPVDPPPTENEGSGSVGPQGSFPPATPYPDPARSGGPGYYYSDWPWC